MYPAIQPGASTPTSPSLAESNEPPARGPESKRRQNMTKTACVECQKRKSKCDGKRPTCTLCEIRHQGLCIYETPEHMTRLQSLKRDHSDLVEQNQTLQTFSKLIRRLRGDDVDFVMHQMRLFGLEKPAMLFKNVLGHDLPSQMRENTNMSQPAREDVPGRSTGGDAAMTSSETEQGPSVQQVTDKIVEKYQRSKRSGDTKGKLAERLEGADRTYDEREHVDFPGETQAGRLKLADHLCLPQTIIYQSQVDRAIISYRDAALDMIAEGQSAASVLGEDSFVNLELVFRDRRPDDNHCVSNFACEYFKALDGAQDFFTTLARILHLALFMRWMILPTKANFSRVPVMIRPLRSQILFPHRPAIDAEAHPAIREALMTRDRDYTSPADWALSEASVNWPHELDDAVYRDAVTGKRRLTEQFEKHVQNEGNWTYKRASLEVFPELFQLGAKVQD